MMTDLAKRTIKAMAGDAREPGSSIAAHMPTLSLLAGEASFGQIVELGVGRGWSTLAILSGTVGRRPLVSFDTDAGTRARALAAMGLPDGHPALQWWEFRQGSSKEAHRQYEAGSVSLLFLDTTHVYEDTREELELWLPKLHAEGILCGHDYLLYELPGHESSTGVKRAVDEFVAKHSSRFDLQVLPHDCGLFILWPR